MAGRPVHTFEVVGTEDLAPHLKRVVLGGPGFDTFTPTEYTDAYVKCCSSRTASTSTRCPVR